VSLRDACERIAHPMGIGSDAPKSHW